MNDFEGLKEIQRDFEADIMTIIMLLNQNGLNYEADTFRVNPLHLQFVQLISK